jgi:hypothetical protein
MEYLSGSIWRYNPAEFTMTPFALQLGRTRDLTVLEA